MSKKRAIKLQYGKVKELAIVCGVSEKSVQRALKYERDTANGSLIRRRAYEMGFIRMF